MIYYFLYTFFVIVWIIVIYYIFNRDKFKTKNDHKPQSTFDVIATPNESKIRVVFDQSDSANLDVKSLADLTVKYSDLISANDTLDKAEKREVLTEENKPEKTENMDLSEYINIFTIKN